MIGWLDRFYGLSTLVVYLIAQSAAFLQRCKTLPNECLGYYTKQFDGEVPVMLELSGCGEPNYCQGSQVHSGSEWWHLTGSYLWVK